MCGSNEFKKFTQALRSHLLEELGPDTLRGPEVFVEADFWHLWRLEQNDYKVGVFVVPKHPTMVRVLSSGRRHIAFDLADPDSLPQIVARVREIRKDKP